MDALTRKLLFICFFLISLNSSIFSQFKSRISVLINDVHYESGVLTVKYDVIDAKENDNIRVWIDLFNSKKDTIYAKSWQGDVNKTLSGKQEKVAYWNVFKDEMDIVDSITVKISATVENRFYLDDPHVLSAIYPGWGDYKIRPQKPYWIYGAVAYTFAGAAIGMHYNASNSYDKYLNANTINDKNDLYKKSVVSKKLSYAFISVAGVVWIMDQIGIAKRKKEIKKDWKKNLPIRENPNVPSFKIVSALSDKIFINSRLTNLQLVEGSVKYVDLDGNSCLDAFEEGNLQFRLYNHGPANAVYFYARVFSEDKNSMVKLPDSLLIGSIGVNQSRLVSIPIKADKKITNGSLSLKVSVMAKYNNPVNPFKIDLTTCQFDYQNKITERDLNSEVDFNIPVLPDDGKERFALIIGNEGYANEKTGLSKNFNVPFARNDALAFKKYAINVLGVKENNVIILLDAKKKEMYENIFVLSDRVKQLKNRAELIFYFAGHGLSDTITTAPYLMPVDIPPGKLSAAVSLDSLYKKIADSKSVRSLVFLDASFNNSGRTIGLRGPDAGKIQFRPEVIPSNTVVFTAVWKNANIVANKEKEHGLFTYALLKTLKDSKGNISFLQLDNTMNSEMLSYTRIPNENRAITTFYSKDISDIWPKWKVR